ncbi:hypothetical protein [Naumannella halotolerans]|uniref:Plasmid replication, integration and excision activator n=1 Tax=Naumannella halotolerans TaxID=993414 RepID=A0A4R7J7P7_9ACTN|nr:hypothetical protein [Naumannella halotolerans]TDT32483.1 hypothetical protein CLV29_0061 [Naumannella halotolerans]
MGVQGPFQVSFQQVFPHGAGVVGEVSKQRDFDRSSKEREVQQVDERTGLPVWVVDVMDFDPEARERTHRVKLLADVQPVPPEAIPGVPVRPVVLSELTVTPYLKDVGNGRQRIAFSLRATGMASPKGGRAAGDSKAA